MFDSFLKKKNQNKVALSNARKLNMQYCDENNANNTIVSQNMSVSLDTSKTKKNNNIIVIGSAGTGKSRSFIKPNLCNMPDNTSIVINDTHGEYLTDTGKMLSENGYNIKVLNLTDELKSNKYNPFNYFQTEEDVLLMADCLLTNVADHNSYGKGKDGFFEKSQRLLLETIMLLVHRYGDELHIKKNMLSVLELIRTSSNVEGNKTDVYFDALERSGWYFNEKNEFSLGKPPICSGLKYYEPCGENEPCVELYHKFLQCTDGTRNSIVISLLCRLSALESTLSSSILDDDNIALDKINKEKTALFIVLPMDNCYYDFIEAMLYTQLFNIICREDCERYHVRCYMDEFAKTYIPNIAETFALSKSHNLSCALIIQNIAQIRSKYKDNWQSLFTCDSLLFLGSVEYDTIDFISKKMGYGKPDNELDMPLAIAPVVQKLPYNRCIYFLTGELPVVDEKYNYTQHPNYNLTGEADKNNEFNLDGLF